MNPNLSSAEWQTLWERGAFIGPSNDRKKWVVICPKYSDGKPCGRAEAADSSAKLALKLAIEVADAPPVPTPLKRMIAKAARKSSPSNA